MTPPRSPLDIIAEFLWRGDFGHTRQTWAKLTPEKRRPYVERAAALPGDLERGGWASIAVLLRVAG